VGNTIAINGSSIYAGGISFQSTGWNNQGSFSFAGEFNDGASEEAWVVKITDGGNSPTLNWGQWLGGNDIDDVNALAISGSNIYAGGYTVQSTGWNNQGSFTFAGQYNVGATNQGWVVKITDGGSSPSLSWGQWLGGNKQDRTATLAVNGSNIYAGGYSTRSTGWNNQGSGTFAGIYNAGAADEGWVVKITDGGSSPTLSWGQWLGGNNSDEPLALAVNGSSIYAGGFSAQSTGWNNQGSGTFAGIYNAGAADEGWVVKITDGGSSPTLSWGQWLGGNNSDEPLALAVNGSSIYAAGTSLQTTGWNNQGSATFAGQFNAGANPETWVVKITDKVSSPSLSWGQWLGGNKGDDAFAMAINGSSIYVGGYSSRSTGWNNQGSGTFTGKYNAGAFFEGWVIKETDNDANAVYTDPNF